MNVTYMIYLNQSMHWGIFCSTQTTKRGEENELQGS